MAGNQAPDKSPAAEMDSVQTLRYFIFSEVLSTLNQLFPSQVSQDTTMKTLQPFHAKTGTLLHQIYDPLPQRKEREKKKQQKKNLELH